MKGRLCLLLLLVLVDARSGHHKHYDATNARHNTYTGGNEEAGLHYVLMETRMDSTCFKRQLSFNDKQSDDEIAENEEIGELQGTVFDFRGRKVIYKIDNGPLCTELTKEDVKRIIDEAAATWNRVPYANVLLVNIDDWEGSNQSQPEDKQSGNESEQDNEADKDNDFNNEIDYNNNFNNNFNNNNNADDDEFNGFEVDELNMSNEVEMPDVDIIISFEPCQHLKHRDRKPNLLVEEFVNCEAIYAHAHSFGDIHLNTLMTWTDRTYSREEDVVGQFVKPNLYSIALHEFGHSLGLRHTYKPTIEDVMFWDFSGMRKHEKLELSQNDMIKLQNLYPVKSKWECKDKTRECSNIKDVCNNAELRPACPATCGDCDECGENIVDEYLKCSDKICNDRGHVLRKYCTKTCKLCEETKTCPDLPNNITHLTTSNTALPVEAGKGVTVSCEAGYDMAGDDVIICVEGRSWTWREEPQCLPKPATSGPAPVDECKDKKTEKFCKGKKRKCGKAKIKTSCPMTCGLCHPTTDPGPATVDECKDKSKKFCKGKKKRCGKANIKTSCPMTCGQCPRSTG